jgi:hypothetical protein
VCLNRQNQELPLALLLTYKPFQKRFNAKTTILRIENTANKVLLIFKEYLYKKKLPKELISMDHLVALADVARISWIQDKILIELCLEKIQLYKCEEDEYLKQASIAARAGDIAFKQKNFQEAKKYYSDAVKQRNRDYLSSSALGKIAMKQKKYKKAAIEFENASQFAPFSNKLYFYQAKSLVEYVKQFQERIEHFQTTSLLLIKKLYLEENIKSDLKRFLDALEKYFFKNNELAGEFGFSREIMRCLELTQEDEMDIGLTSSSKTSSQEEAFEENKPIVGRFFFEHLQDLHLQFREVLARVKKKLLSKAEFLLEKMSPATDNEIEKNSFILQRLLAEEIYYERGHFEEASFVFEQIEKMIKDNIINLNIKEKLCFYDNLSKLSLANGQIESAKRALSELRIIDPDNKEFERRHMLCQQEMIFWYGSDFHEQDVDAQYKIGVVQFNRALGANYKKEDESERKHYENAKKHFLKADPYNAYVNFYLGKIEKPNYYFKKALKFALFDKLDFSFCLEIAEHFLTNGIEENVFIELIILFSDDSFTESDAEMRCEILHRLAEKIENEEVRQFALVTSQKLYPNHLSPMNQPDDDKQKYVDQGLDKINNFVPPSMKRGYICPECLIQKLNTLSLEAESAGIESRKELTISEIVESITVPTSLHNHVEPIEIQTIANLKQPTRLSDEDKIIKNLKAMCSKVEKGLQKKESFKERMSTIKTAKIILHTLRNVFPDEIKILLLLGKIYYEEKNFLKASFCFENLKNIEFLDHKETSLLGYEEDVFIEAKDLYDLTISALQGNLKV